MVYYQCAELKSVSESEPYHQKELEEVRGQLLRVLVLNGFSVAIFPFAAIALPEEMREQLEGLVGKEVCCLRLDNKYYIREA